MHPGRNVQLLSQSKKGMTVRTFAIVPDKGALILLSPGAYPPGAVFSNRQLIAKRCQSRWFLDHRLPIMRV